MTLSLSGAAAALESVAHDLAGVDPRLAALALVFHVTNHLLRSVAWRNVVAAAYPGTRVRLLPIAAAYATGVALNAVAPARGGDAAKVALARGALSGSSVPTLAATVSVLVVFDVVFATALLLVVAAAGLVPVQLPSAGAVAAHWPVVLAAAAALAAAGYVAGRVAHRRLRVLWERVRQGGAILRTPGCYLRRVALVQAGAWCCRIAVVLCLLAGFGLPASIPVAGVVMVVAGASTLIPLAPGGAGAQQIMVAFALSQTASAAAVVSFSVGMQAGVTAVNALLGLAAAMAVFRTVRPLAAARGALAAARA